METLIKDLRYGIRSLLIDRRVLLFTLGLSLLAGVVFGLAPALRASRPELIPSLKDDAAAFFERTRLFGLRNLLVVTQVALSVVLLIAAGLFLRSLRQAQTIDPGFDAAKIVSLPLNINLLRCSRVMCLRAARPKSIRSRRSDTNRVTKRHKK